MANYNFTVRATDSAGAFADQNFSVNVQRTRIDRFLAFGTSPGPTLFRSPDGVKWTAEASPLSTQHDMVVWSNDRWIAPPVYFNSSTPDPVWTSVDAINWKPNTLNLPKGIYNLGPFPTAIRYRSGKWFCYTSARRTTNLWDVVEFTSDDFVTWTQSSIVFSGTSTNDAVRANEFAYDGVLDTTVVAVYSGNTIVRGTFTRVGNGAWVYNALSPSIVDYSSISFLNGIWTYVIRGSQTVMFSRNGLDWFSRQFPAAISGACFSNGKLAVLCNNGKLYLSSDAAVTWTESVASFTSPSTKRALATYGGRIVSVGGGSTTETTTAGAIATSNSQVTGYYAGIYTISARA